MKDIFPDCPVVLHSGDSTLRTIAENHNAEFLDKPATFREMSRAINRANARCREDDYDFVADDLAFDAYREARF